jgi:hypothetical protein
MLRLALITLPGVALACSAVVSPPASQPQAAAASAAEASAGGDMPAADRFAFVAPQSSMTDQQVLNAYSRRGYRLLLADAGHLLFEKLPADLHGPDYLTFDRRKTWQRQLDDAAGRGYRLSHTTHPLMERPTPAISEAEHRYEYKAVWRDGASLREFEGRIAEAASKGYRPRAVYMVDWYDPEESLVVLESSTRGASPQGAAVPSDTFKLVEFKDLRKSTARFRSYVSRGYRMILRGDTRMLNAESCRMQSTVVLQYAPERGPIEYVVVEPTGHAPESVARHAQRDMNEAASRGWRLAPDGLFLAFGWSCRLGLVMEKSSEVAPALEYKVIGAVRVSTLTRELDSAFAQGFTPVAMIMGGPRFVVLQKAHRRSPDPR